MSVDNADSHRILLKSQFSISKHKSIIKDRNFKNSRLYDNHFDVEVHPHPWLALGTFKEDQFKKVQYSDAGLGQITIKTQKMRNFRDLSEVNDQIKLIADKDNGWRQFLEFKDTQDGEVVITIEYCTNCTQHQGSTRHSESQYFETAQTLKHLILQNFPSVKVYLKPLIFVREFSADSLYLQRRIGAFEVQIISKLDKYQQAILYSKLRQKSWPAMKYIVNQIPQYLKRINFSVQLQFNDSRASLMTDEMPNSNVSILAKLQSNLKNISATLTPIRQIQQTQLPKTQARTQSQESTIRGGKLNQSDLQISMKIQDTNQHRITRSQSQTVQDKMSTTFMLRPNTSSATNFRQKTSSSVSRRKMLDQSQLNTSVAPSIVAADTAQFIEQSDAQGRLLFMNVPSDNYNLTIEESYNHQAVHQQINLFDMAEGSAQQIELKKPTRCYLKVEICEQQVDQKFEVPIFDADVQLLSCRTNKYTKSTKLKDQIPNSGIYEILVEPEAYWVFIKKFGYATQKKKCIARAGEMRVKILMHKEALDSEVNTDQSMQHLINQQLLLSGSAKDQFVSVKRSRYLKPPSANNVSLLALLELSTIQVVDMFTKRVIAQVLVKISEETTNKLFSYTTTAEGRFKIYASSLQCGRIIIEHSDYYTREELYGTHKQIDLKCVKQISLIRRPKQNDIEFILTTSTQRANFYVKMPDAQISSGFNNHHGEQSHYEQDGLVHYKMSKSDFAQNGSYTIFTVLSSPVSGANHIKVLLHDEMIVIDAPLQQSNVVTFPCFWIFATIYIDSQSNYVVLRQDNLCSSLEFQSMPTIQKELPVNQIVSSFWTHNQNDDYEFQLVIDRLKSILHNSVIGYIDGQIILKGQQHQLLSKAKVVGVFDLGADLKIFISENLVANISGQEKKLYIGDLLQLQMKQYDPKNQNNYFEEEYQKKTVEVSPFASLHVTVSQCCVVNNLLLLGFTGRREVTVFTWPKLDGIGYYSPFVNCAIDFLHDAGNSSIITVGQRDLEEPNIRIWKIDQNLDRPSFMCLQENSSHAKISCSKMWYQGQAIILGQVNGFVAIHSIQTLELLQFISHTESIVRSIFCSGQTLLFVDEQSRIGIFVQSEHSDSKFKLKFKKKEQINSPYQINYDAICVQNDDLYTITQQGYLACWQNFNKRPPSIFKYLNNEAIEDIHPSQEESYIVIQTNADINKFSPVKLDANCDEADGIHFQYFSRTDGENTIVIKCTNLDDHLVRIGLHFNNIERNNTPHFQIYFINVQGYKEIPQPDFQNKIQGLWMLGVVADVGNSHQFLSLNTISDVSITMLPTYSLGDTQTASRGNMSGDNRVIMPTDRGLQEFDCLNFSHHQLIPDTVTTQKVTCVSLMDNNHVLVGHQNGSCLVLKKGPLDCWCVHKRFQHNDRAITDCVLIENSIVVSSEDRKLLMINLQSGLVEFQDQVDRTFVNCMSKYQKDCFVGGFPDGRLKLWRREKNGFKISTRIVRTIITIKIKCIQLAPFQHNLVAVGGIDQGLEVYNIETGLLVRSYLNGHAAAVESIAFIGKTMITSGSDSKIILWTHHQNLPQKVFPCSEIHRKLVSCVDSTSFVTLTSSGKVVLWNEIAGAARLLNDTNEKSSPSKLKVADFIV